MERKNGNGSKNGGGMVCHDPMHGCGCCCYGGYPARHAILRIIIALALLGFVFSMGVKLGELKRDLQSGAFYGNYGDYNRHMMMHGWNVRGGDFYNPGDADADSDPTGQSSNTPNSQAQ